MNNLTELFERSRAEKKKILSIFTVAGFPSLESTVEICAALEEAGVDLIELGVPFSDSLVDGPTVQSAYTSALSNGTTLKKIVALCKDIRQRVSIPLVLMGCYNPLFQFGMERLIGELRDNSIEGILIPDLPRTVYEANYQELIQGAGVSYVSLVTERTRPAELKEIDRVTSGFLYAVSGTGVTGGSFGGSNSSLSFLEKLSSTPRKNPVLTGFGIHDRDSYSLAVKHTDGAIIGSSFLRLVPKIMEQGIDSDVIPQFVREFR